ncbi:MAG: hypothetical protein K0V04_38360 [Deltaproteobacteria bacterium]|nr:hypothetical protein [Deltaproteobacteria bacterium]
MSTWWPLALSWLMMGVEQPLVGAVVARLPDAQVQLAAYGSVVFPLALVIEAPVIMLLAASTELSRDRAAYGALARVSHRLGLVLTALHLLVAVTPVFDWLAQGVLHVPDPVLEPARIGLLLLLPWPWAIASRRFHQGVLIRHGHSRAVGWGTGLRMLTSSGVLTAGLVHGQLPGTIVGPVAMSAGVVAEAIYAALRVRSVRRALQPTSDRPPLRGLAFARFYAPLAMTPLITLVILPVGTAAVSRMPEALASLAVWPLVNAVAFVLQSLGLAYNEVVVALLDEPGARAPLLRFTGILAAATTSVLAVLALTPLADVWFAQVAGLSAPLASMGAAALWLALPIPGTRVLQSWFQGLLVHARRTRAITEAVAVFAVTCCTVLWVGVVQAQWSGLTVVVIAYSTGRLMQTMWLAMRTRDLRRGPASSPRR